jgi:hypothetical protein
VGLREDEARLPDVAPTTPLHRLHADHAAEPIRGVLYTFSDSSYWLVGVQLLDGVGAGIYGAIFPIIVADPMRGTGRFNLNP